MAAAFDMAKETAPATLTSKYQVDIAVADRDISRAKSLPQLSLFGQWSENKIEYDGPLTGGFPDQRYPGERYGLQASQRLFSLADWKETGMRSAMLRQTKDVFEDQEGRLLLSVADAYFNVLQSVRVLESAQSGIRGSGRATQGSRSVEEPGACWQLRSSMKSRPAEIWLLQMLLVLKAINSLQRKAWAQLIGVRDFTLFSASSTNLLLPSASTLEEALSRSFERIRNSRPQDMLSMQQNMMLNEKRARVGLKFHFFLTVSILMLVSII